jgi:hypothetical protein
VFAGSTPALGTFNGRNDSSSQSSPECSPPCQGGDRGFKSHRRRLSAGMVRKSATRRSSNLRESVGSNPTHATKKTQNASAGHWRAQVAVTHPHFALAVRLRPGALIHRPVRLSVQDTSLSRWKDGFNSHTGHFDKGPACRWGRLILARSVRSVRLRSGPLKERADGPTGRHRPGVAEIRVRFSVSPLWYGRQPDTVGRAALLMRAPLTGMWVRIPCLPLLARW